MISRDPRPMRLHWLLIAALSPLDAGCNVGLSALEHKTPSQCGDCDRAFRLAARLSIPRACTSVSALKWRVEECHGDQCPVTANAVDTTSIAFTPDTPIVVLLESSNASTVLVQGEVFPERLPIVSGDEYGLRVVATATGKVLYDERMPAEMQSCFSTHPECRGLHLELPESAVTTGDFDGAGSCSP